jgi:PGF-CTERM protein
MQRRALLRSGAVLGVGAGLLGRASAHPTPSATTERPPSDDGAADETSTPSERYSPLGQVDVEGATEAVASEDGHVVYVAATTGYVVVDVTDPASPEILAERRDLLPDRESGPLEQIYDVKLDGDTLLVVGPANGQREPTLMGMLVVDVSDPADPSRRAFYETDYPIHNCYLDGETAYLTANGQSIRLEIVDVGGENPTQIGSWALEDEDDRWSEVRRGMRVVHDVFVQDGVAYLAHWDAGTWLLDVSAPAAPEALSHVAEQSLDDLLAKSAEEGGSHRIVLPGNSHYVAVDETASVLGVGREAWAVDGESDVGPGGIDLYDVSEPTAPEKLSSIDPPESPDPTISGIWTTAHNFEFRDGVLYSSWYQGGVKRHDVSDPTNPRERTWWADAGQTRFWTARVAAPGETFVASSLGTTQGRAGLFVFPDEAGQTVQGLGAEDVTTTATPSATTRPGDSPTEGAEGPPPTTTSTETPGFGVLTGLAGLGAGALALHSRRREE